MLKKLFLLLSLITLNTGLSAVFFAVHNDSNGRIRVLCYVRENQINTFIGQRDINNHDYEVFLLPGHHSTYFFSIANQGNHEYTPLINITEQQFYRFPGFHNDVDDNDVDDDGDDDEDDDEGEEDDNDDETMDNEIL